MSPRPANPHREFGIAGLHRILTGALALVYVLLIFVPAFSDKLAFNPVLVLSGEIWRPVTGLLLPTPVAVPAEALISMRAVLYMIIKLYIVYRLGDALESLWGVKKFSLVLLSTIAINTIVVLLLVFISPNLAVSFGFGSYVLLYQVIFLAYALEFPHTEFLLFFLLPVKVKWFAYVMIAFIAYDAMQISKAIGNPLPFVIYAVIFSPLLRLVYPILKDRAVSRQRRIAYQGKQAPSAVKPGQSAFHTCSVCGTTDLDKPDLDFRVLENGDEICTNCLEKR